MTETALPYRSLAMPNGVHAPPESTPCQSAKIDNIFFAKRDGVATGWVSFQTNRASIAKAMPQINPQLGIQYLALWILLLIICTLG